MTKLLTNTICLCIIHNQERGNKMKYDLIKIFERTIIDNNDNGEIINKMIKFNMINLNDLLEKIIKTNNGEYIYRFALHIEGAPIDKLVEAIIITIINYFIYVFAIID